MVYTLVAKNTIDEKIITMGYQKRRLEKLVIHNGKCDKWIISAVMGISIQIENTNTKN